MSLQEYNLRADELGSWEARREHWRRHAAANGKSDWAFGDLRRFREQVLSLVNRPLPAEWIESDGTVGAQ